ncbi:MAG: pyruvate kinase [Acidobacteria bacterium]|nr:pyruvate kinase [Acidobacteriota bacterium]
MIPHHRTKIVGTLGPAMDDPRVLRECILAGLDIARLNAAHGTGEEQIRRVRALRKTARDLNRPVGLLVDLPGPKFRLGNLPGGQRELRPGEIIRLGSPADIDSKGLPVRDAGILASMERGHFLYLADGTVTLIIVGLGGSIVKGRVVIGGVVRSGSGINIPDTDVRIRIPTPSDLRGIAFAARQKAEWIGISFVRTVKDISGVRRAFSRFRHNPRIIAKIEKPQALANLGDLLQEADGLMVARGDLGVETPLAQVPLAQKRIIAEANEAGKPVITATQMLESMVNHRWPTRAEVADVANAVLDGTDAVMLSAETAIGKYPAEAIRILASVLTATEAAYPFHAFLNAPTQKPVSLPGNAISRSACRLAWDAGAKAIIISSHSEALPYSVSRFRPSVPIIVLTGNRMITRQLALSWGVETVLTDPGASESLEPARGWLLKNRLARSGDSVVWIHPTDRRKDSSGNSIRLAAI